jgi:2,4-dienoyl-CoA reductase [(3E)-enoyl-CoA-producing], peroxisomal
MKAVMRHGANAAIMGRKVDRLTKAAEDLSRSTRNTCVATPGDVRSYEDVQKAVADTIKKFGRIDYVICGAAGNFLTSLEGLSPKGFQTVQQIDLQGTYHTFKATLDELKKTHGR